MIPCSFLSNFFVFPRVNNCPLLIVVFYAYTGVGKTRFTVVHMGKDMQVMIVTTAFVPQNNITAQWQTYFCRPLPSRYNSNLVFPRHSHPSSILYILYLRRMAPKAFYLLKSGLVAFYSCTGVRPGASSPPCGGSLRLSPMLDPSFL